MDVTIVQDVKQYPVTVVLMPAGRRVEPCAGAGCVRRDSRRNNLLYGDLEREGLGRYVDCFF